MMRPGPDRENSTIAAASGTIRPNASIKLAFINAVSMPSASNEPCFTGHSTSSASGPAAQGVAHSMASPPVVNTIRQHARSLSPHFPGDLTLDLRKVSSEGSLPVATLKGRPSFLERKVGRMTVNGVRHSMLTLTCTALGGGVLSVSYVMYLSGVALGVGMLLLGATIAYVSTSALMQMSLATEEHTYAGLFAHCAGPRAGPVLDAMLFVYGNGTCIGYMVFIADFIPALVSLVAPGAPDWMAGREFAILSAVLVITPLALQRDIATLRHVAPISVMSLVYMAGVIAAKAPSEYRRHIEDDGPVRYLQFGIANLDSFALCVFAFNCHINVVPVAGSLIRPSKARITKISAWVNVVQFCFYGLIGVSGYVSFLALTKQDVIMSYSDGDRLVAIGRALLTCSMCVAIPMNLFPAVRSGMQIKDFFRRPSSSALLAPSPVASPRANGQLPQPIPSCAAETTRITVTVFCLLMQACVAYWATGVADVLSFLGATVAPLMMMVIPGYAVGVCMPSTRKNQAKKIFLYTFALLAMASIPMKILRWAQVIQ